MEMDVSSENPPVVELVGCRLYDPSELDDPIRLKVLRESGILERRQPELDRLTNLASTILGSDIVIASFVEADRQVFSSQTGLPEPWSSAGQTPLSHSFCQHVVTNGQPLLVEAAELDERVKNNLAISELGVAAYAGYPISCQGETLGSFCAIYSSPHVWNEFELRVLRQFSETISDQLNLKFELALHALDRTNLERANRGLDNFAAILSHDLKTPLRGIVGCLKLLEKRLEPLAEEPAELLRHATNSAHHMSGLIDALREYGRIFSKESVFESLDLDELFAAVALDLSADLQESEGILVCDTPLGQITGCKFRVRQLFQNLISNGLKFQPSNQKPVINIGRNGSSFYVKDNGVGFDSSQCQRIFGMYQRAHTREEYSGMGMGLAICSRLVSESGGSIWAESSPGQGATFWFTLG